MWILPKRHRIITDKILKTHDGSFTYFNQNFNQSYHSLKDGAYTETLHKHILPPILFTNSLTKSKIRVLDICFGLGYNSFLTFSEYFKRGYRGKIEIFSPEIDTEIFDKISNIQYPHELSNINIPQIIDGLKSKNYALISSDAFLEVFFGDAREYMDKFEDIDIVYQDAFSPKMNPELWSKEYFKRLFEITSSECIITTYSLDQEVYKNVKEAGFLIYRYESGFARKSSLFTKQELKQNKNLILW